MVVAQEGYTTNYHQDYVTALPYVKEFIIDIEGETKNELEVIYPFPVHPAIDNPFEAIIIIEDRNLTVTEAQDSTVAPAMYTDRSARNGLTGHAVTWLQRELSSINIKTVLKTREGEWIAVYETAAPRDDDNEYAVELRAIRKAVRIL
ncbi:hypothetical protein F5884DRAFT_863742 [Xylogone sp. PMI_703]|nr:hypothetical protein F5884DRAFT_863742 [Xylogone sp. PMI_703]